MKKVLLLVSLVTVLSSCGGGGGGGGSSQTGSTTPVPNNPTQPGNSNAQNPTQPGNNQPGNSSAQNPSQPGNNQPGNSNAQNPSHSGSNNPSQNQITGKGVSVAVLDSDFISPDVHTNQLYHKESYLGEILDREFKDRFIQETKSSDPNRNNLSKNNHGIIVATILGGNSGTGATGAKIHGVSVSQGSGFYLDINKCS